MIDMYIVCQRLIAHEGLRLQPFVYFSGVLCYTHQKPRDMNQIRIIKG